MVLNIKEFIEFDKEIDKKILLNSEVLKIILFNLKEKNSIKPHSNPGIVVMECVYGEGIFQKGRDFIDAKEGRIVVCERNELHAFEAKTNFSVLAFIYNPNISF